MSTGRYSYRGGEMLASVEAHVAELLRTELPAAGVPSSRVERLAETIGKQVADTLRTSWGGQHVYIPFDRARRNAAIYEEFSGENHSELAEKYHMSTRHIYAIVEAERNRRRHKQLTLL